MIRYEELTWQQVKESLNYKLLIIPVGSIEQHGPHLPLMVDSILAEKLSERIAAEIDGIVAPVITYGGRSLPTSGGGFSYPGTIYIDGITLIKMYEQIIKSFIRSGATRILILNAHWENEAFLVEAVDRCREQDCLKQSEVTVLSWWNVVTEEEMNSIFGQFPGWHAEHAGQAETALMYYHFSEYTKKLLAVDCNNKIPNGIYKYPVPEGWNGTQGVLSKTKHVTAEMGGQLSQLVVDKICRIYKRKVDVI